jgi:hypothetical protein
MTTTRINETIPAEVLDTADSYAWSFSVQANYADAYAVAFVSSVVRQGVVLPEHATVAELAALLQLSTEQVQAVSRLTSLVSVSDPSPRWNS